MEVEEKPKRAAGPVLQLNIGVVSLIITLAIHVLIVGIAYGSVKQTLEDTGRRLTRIESWIDSQRP